MTPVETDPRNEFDKRITKLSSDLRESGEEWLAAREFREQASHFVAAAFAGRSLALLDGMERLVEERWDVTGVLLRVLVESSINGIVVALGGRDEAVRLDTEQQAQLVSFAEANDLSYQPSSGLSSGKRARNFDQQVERADSLLRAHNESSTSSFEMETYAHVYKMMSLREVHGVTTTAPYRGPGLRISTRPAPAEAMARSTYLSMAIPYVAIQLSVLGDVVGDSIPGLRDIESKWAAL